MKLRNPKLLCTFIFLGLFLLLSAIKVVVLPQGGAVTYLSLLALWLVTYCFGFKYGLVCSVLFGFARLGVNYLTAEYINYHPMAILLEYPLGYGIFCLGGLLREPGTEKNGSPAIEPVGPVAEPFKLKMGYVIGLLGQFVLYVVSAVCFYPLDRVGFLDNLLFCMIYDGSYLAIEGIITVLVLCIPPVYESIYYLKYVVTRENEDDTLLYF